MNCSGFNLPAVSVPFDFDGERLVWLEFKEKKEKRLAVYSIAT